MSQNSHKIKKEVSINSSRFIGSKDSGEPYYPIMTSFKTAKKVRILTFGFPEKQKSKKIQWLRELSPNIDFKLIVTLRGLDFVKEDDTTNYDAYTEESIRNKLDDLLKILDIKQFHNTRSIEVCFKNHAKIIGTEKAAYIGSSNYSDMTRNLYEAGFIIDETDKIEEIYTDFIDQIKTVRYLGDDLDAVRIGLLHINEELTEFSEMLSESQHSCYPGYELSDTVKEIKTLIKDETEVFKKHVLYEDQQDTLESILDQIDEFFKREDLLQLLESMTDDNIRETLNGTYRTKHGLLYDAPNSKYYQDYVGDGELFVNLTDMYLDEVSDIIDELWPEVFEGDQTIVDSVNTLNGIVESIGELILRLEEDSIEQFKKDVISQGTDPDIEK